MLGAIHKGSPQMFAYFFSPLPFVRMCPNSQIPPSERPHFFWKNQQRSIMIIFVNFNHLFLLTNNL